MKQRQDQSRPIKAPAAVYLAPERKRSQPVSHPHVLMQVASSHLSEANHSYAGPRQARETIRPQGFQKKNSILNGIGQPRWEIKRPRQEENCSSYIMKRISPTCK